METKRVAAVTSLVIAAVTALMTPQDEATARSMALSLLSINLNVIPLVLVFVTLNKSTRVVSTFEDSDRELKRLKTDAKDLRLAFFLLLLLGIALLTRQISETNLLGEILRHLSIGEIRMWQIRWRVFFVAQFLTLTSSLVAVLYQLHLRYDKTKIECNEIEKKRRGVNFFQAPKL